VQAAAEVHRIIITTLAALVYILPFIIIEEYCPWGIHVNSPIYYLSKWVKIVQGNYACNFICPSFNTSASTPLLFFSFPTAESGFLLDFSTVDCKVRQRNKK